MSAAFTGSIHEWALIIAALRLYADRSAKTDAGEAAALADTIEYGKVAPPEKKADS